MEGRQPEVHHEEAEKGLAWTGKAVRYAAMEFTRRVPPELLQNWKGSTTNTRSLTTAALSCNVCVKTKHSLCLNVSIISPADQHQVRCQVNALLNRRG